MGTKKLRQKHPFARQVMQKEQEEQTLVNFLKKDVSEGWEALKTGDWNTNKLKELKEMF